MSNRVRGGLTQAEWDANRAEVKAEAAEVVAENARVAQEELVSFRKGQGYPQVAQVASEDESDASEDPYDGWTNAQLSEELEKRELPHSGTKDELLARLAESDAGTE